jgi:hypothetical protein
MTMDANQFYLIFKIVNGAEITKLLGIGNCSCFVAPHMVCHTIFSKWFKPI